jgi:hypothetical protein
LLGVISPCSGYDDYDSRNSDGHLDGPGTCANLSCHDHFSYFLKVNTAGRITEYYGWLEELGW